MAKFTMIPPTPLQRQVRARRWLDENCPDEWDKDITGTFFVRVPGADKLVYAPDITTLAQRAAEAMDAEDPTE